MLQIHLQNAYQRQQADSKSSPKPNSDICATILLSILAAEPVIAHVWHNQKRTAPALSILMPRPQPVTPSCSPLRLGQKDPVERPASRIKLAAEVEIQVLAK